MVTMSDLLSFRASFELAALAVTWLLLVLLVLVVGSLHVRLRRLETRTGPSPIAAPYSFLLGKRVEDVIGVVAGGPQPRVLLFLSSTCGSCHRLLEELASPSWTVPTALLWTDGTAPAARHAQSATVVSDGPRISAELGIRVTPFALVTDKDGLVIKAGPLSSLRSLTDVDGLSSAQFRPIGEFTTTGDGQP